uniref:Uncharacterized protein n=1 Tax=Timema genevievae TaxID=629358 RepID=A0A7R9JRL7_TIMGE|nr:unnamed protein product [Timema genevievae]
MHGLGSVEKVSNDGNWGECCDITRNDEDRGDLSCRATKLAPVKEIAGSLLKHIVTSETMLEPALNSHQAWATPHSKGWGTFQRAECRAKPDRCDKKDSRATGLRVSTLECVFSHCTKTGVRRRQTDVTPTVSTTPPINKTPFVDNRQPTVYRPTGGNKRPSQENERHPVSTRRPTNNNYNEPQITSTRSRPQEEFEWITEQPLSIQRYSDATLDPLPSINTPSPPLKEYRPREPLPNESWKTTPRSPSTRRPQDTRPETELRPTDLYDRGCSSLKTLKLGRTMCMAHSSVLNFCSASNVWGLRDWMIEDGHAHNKTYAENKQFSHSVQSVFFPADQLPTRIARPAALFIKTDPHTKPGTH